MSSVTEGQAELMTCTNIQAAGREDVHRRPIRTIAEGFSKGTIRPAGKSGDISNLAGPVFLGRSTDAELTVETGHER